MQEIEDIKDRLQPHFENPQQEQEVEQIQSQYLRDCREFYGQRSEDNFDKLQGELIDAIRAHNITYDTQQQFCEQTVIKVVNHSNNYEVVQVDVKVGYFTFKNISIVNIDTLFPHNLTNQEGCGSFGAVFQACFENQLIAIKTSFFKKDKSEKIVPQEVGSTIKMFLREFCLSKIASIIGVGPMISNQMGFDLMIYNDCVAYAMEYCQNQNYSQPFASYRSQLQEKMLKLHAIKLVHMDIKQDNICYSRIKKDYVFIDFGLSKIIKEEVGRKSLTNFFGTASHCSQEMSLLISTSKGGYADLYYNDICCLKNSLKSDKEYWKNNKNHVNVDYFYTKIDSKLLQKYEKTVIVPYLKFLLYKFKVEKFKQIFKNHLHSLQKVYIEQILVFIQGFNFSSSLFLVLREFQEIIQYDTFDKTSRGVFLSEENIEFYRYNFAILEGINSIEEKQKAKTIKDAEKEREMLNQMSIVERLNWKIYLKLLIEVIQINKNNCSFNAKNELCLTAKKLFAKGYIPDLTLFEQKSNALAQVSESLLRFSLTQPIDATKITIFHSIIYNIVLLHTIDLEGIFEIYKTILHLPLAISDRARMLLKIRTTLVLRQFQVRFSYADRITITDGLSEIDEQYYNEENLLTESERQFLKAANMGYLHKQTKTNVSLIKQAFKKMITQNAYAEYLKDQDFARQIRIWYLCIWVYLQQSSQHLATLESIIFRQMNKIGICFEYFHIILLFASDFNISKLKAKWLSNVFQQIFNKTIVVENYYFNIIFWIIDLKASYYRNYEDFILKVKDNIQLGRVNPTSCFGRLLRIQLHQILLNKKTYELSEEVRSFYLQNKHFLVSYDTNIPQKYVQKCLMLQLEVVFMQEFYGCKFYENLNEVLDNSFRGVYIKLREKVLKMSRKYMNYGLIVLLMFSSYIYFRRKLLQNVVNIFKITITIFTRLQGSNDSYLPLKAQLMQFYFRLASSYTFKTSKQVSNSIIYQNFNETIQEKSIHFKLLSQQYAFCQLYFYLVYNSPEKIPSLINKLSHLVLIQNQDHTASVYYTILDKLIRIPSFLVKLVEVNKSIVNALEDTRINPYNGVYLHHMMCFKALWSHKLFLQICRIFNFIPKDMARQILSNYYKYICFYYSPHNLRKNQFIQRLVLKYGSKYQLTSFRLLQMLIPKESASILKEYGNEEKLMLIRKKLMRYYMSGKSQKIYTRYTLIAQQEEYSLSNRRTSVI